MFSFNNLSHNLKKIFNRQRRGYNLRSTYKVLSQDEIEGFVNNESCVVLDVREEEEFVRMHIKGAINIPVKKLDSTIFNKIYNRRTPILVYCSTGERTSYAISRLNNLGYINIYVWGNGGLNTLNIKDILEYK